MKAAALVATALLFALVSCDPKKPTEAVEPAAKSAAPSASAVVAAAPSATASASAGALPSIAGTWTLARHPETVWTLGEGGSLEKSSRDGAHVTGTYSLQANLLILKPKDGLQEPYSIEVLFPHQLIVTDDRGRRLEFTR